MRKYITDERTGLKYELVGNYYLIAGDTLCIIKENNKYVPAGSKDK